MNHKLLYFAEKIHLTINLQENTFIIHENLLFVVSMPVTD